MDITGKLVVFTKQNKDKLTFTTSVSRKLESGNYESVSLSVFFNGELKEKAQKLPVDHSITLEEVEGYLSCYNNKIQVFITKARTTQTKPFTRKETTPQDTNKDGLPF